MEITKDKITEIFCIIDDFCKEYDAEIEKRSRFAEPVTEAFYRTQIIVCILLSSETLDLLSLPLTSCLSSLIKLFHNS